MLTQHASDRATQLPAPRCKHQTTRKACMDLLRTLCNDNLEDKLLVTNYLK